VKVSVTYTTEVSDEEARAMNAYNGKSGRASREEIKEWFKTYGRSKTAELQSIVDRLPPETRYGYVTDEGPGDFFAKTEKEVVKHLTEKYGPRRFRFRFNVDGMEYFFGHPKAEDRVHAYIVATPGMNDYMLVPR